MIRLRRDDFNDPHELAKFAATAGLTLQEFRHEFESLVADEPPPVVFDPELGFLEPGAEEGEPSHPRRTTTAAEPTPETTP